MLRSLSSVFILLLTSVGVFGAESTVDQDARRQEMRRLVAEPLPGGAVTRYTAFYGPDDLHEYMDGAADIFVLYGVRTMLHLELRGTAAEITLDVFDMGSPEAAFGMYAAERSPDFRFVAIGVEGYEYEGMLNFLQDRYYVKLLGFGDGADAALDVLARGLSERIGKKSEFPALLAKLPTENRKAHSEQYMPNDPLGHAFLGPAYVVAYASGDQESKLFVTVARDAADAQQRLKQLEQHFVKTGKCEPEPGGGEGAIRGSNSFEGSVIAETKGRYVVLLVNPVTGSEAILKRAATSLE